MRDDLSEAAEPDGDYYKPVERVEFGCWDRRI